MLYNSYLDNSFIQRTNDDFPVNVSSQTDEYCRFNELSIWMPKNYRKNENKTAIFISSKKDIASKQNEIRFVTFLDTTNYEKTSAVRGWRYNYQKFRTSTYTLLSADYLFFFIVCYYKNH